MLGLDSLAKRRATEKCTFSGGQGFSVGPRFWFDQVLDWTRCCTGHSFPISVTQGVLRDKGSAREDFSWTISN